MTDKIREFATQREAEVAAEHYRTLPAAKKYGYKYQASKLGNGRWGILASAPREQDKFVVDLDV